MNYIDKHELLFLLHWKNELSFCCWSYSCNWPFPKCFI